MGLGFEFTLQDCAYMVCQVSGSYIADLFLSMLASLLGFCCSLPVDFIFLIYFFFSVLGSRGQFYLIHHSSLKEEVKLEELIDSSQFLTRS